MIGLEDNASGSSSKELAIYFPNLRKNGSYTDILSKSAMKDDIPNERGVVLLCNVNVIFVTTTKANAIGAFCSLQEKEFLLLRSQCLVSWDHELLVEQTRDQTSDQAGVLMQCVLRGNTGSGSCRLGIPRRLYGAESPVFPV